MKRWYSLGDACNRAPGDFNVQVRQTPQVWWHLWMKRWYSLGDTCNTAPWDFNVQVRETPQVWHL